MPSVDPIYELAERERQETAALTKSWKKIVETRSAIGHEARVTKHKIEKLTRQSAEASYELAIQLKKMRTELDAAMSECNRMDTVVVHFTQLCDASRQENESLRRQIRDVRSETADVAWQMERWLRGAGESSAAAVAEMQRMDAAMEELASERAAWEFGPVERN